MPFVIVSITVVFCFLFFVVFFFVEKKPRRRSSWQTNDAIATERNVFSEIKNNTYILKPTHFRLLARKTHKTTTVTAHSPRYDAEYHGNDITGSIAIIFVILSNFLVILLKGFSVLRYTSHWIKRYYYWASSLRFYLPRLSPLVHPINHSICWDDLIH